MSDPTVPGDPAQVPPGAEERTGSDRASMYDVSTRTDVHFLHKHAVGLMGVLFLTVTGAAPISAMLFNTPISVGFGNGVGTPAGFLFATVVLTIFSVGYATMAGKITAAGGFYSFISHGLGRELGMGAAFASVVAYSVFEASLTGGFAYFANLKFAQHGIHIRWFWLALAMVGLIAVLTYFDVRLSARLLGLALIGEVIILLIMDIGIFSQGGHHVTASALNPVNAFKGLPGGGGIAAGGAGVGIFFAFWSWVGFEMAPNYAEESKDPKRIVPLSMYISVVGLGIFYVITSWAALSGYHSVNEAAKVAQNDSANFFFIPTKEFLGGGVRDVMSYLIITGSFACGMAFHNTAARYFYSLGRERVLPSVLGRTHHKWKSPHVATLTQSAIAAFIVLLFAIFTGTHDPASQAYLQLYGLMAVMGVIIILSVQAVVSIAIWNYFRVNHPEEQHWWKTMLAPAISFVAQAIVLALLFKNIEFIGSGYGYAKILGPIDAGVFLVGLAGAFYWKKKDRARFDAVGRLINEGV
ncbi:MAG: APC family permease [Gaiellaceae bacterium]